jgi:hypothetical protein
VSVLEAKTNWRLFYVYEHFSTGYSTLQRYLAGS